MYNFQVPILFSLIIVLTTFFFFICVTDSFISEPESFFDSAPLSSENDFFLDDDGSTAASDPFLMDYNFVDRSELRGLAPPSFRTEDDVDFDAAFHESMLANAMKKTTDYSGLVDAEFRTDGFGDDSFLLATETETTDWNWDCPDGKMPLCCTLRGVRTWDPRIFGDCRNCE